MTPPTWLPAPSTPAQGWVHESGRKTHVNPTSTHNLTTAPPPTPCLMTRPSACSTTPYPPAQQSAPWISMVRGTWCTRSLPQHPMTTAHRTLGPHTERRSYTGPAGHTPGGKPMLNTQQQRGGHGHPQTGEQQWAQQPTGCRSGGRFRCGAAPRTPRAARRPAHGLWRLQHNSRCSAPCAEEARRRAGEDG